MRIFALALVLTLLLGPASALPARAQTLPGSVEEVTLTLSPQYPRPYETVTATVGSTQINLAASTITISVNGKVIATGERSASFTVGGAGVRSLVQATAKDSAGTHATQISIFPEDVALVVEPSSSVPPFYRGAKLAASSGPVRVIAMPTFKTGAGAAVAPASLVYTWKFGDKILEAQSGIGKNVLTATAPVRYRDARITVTVTSQDQALVAQATSLLSAVDPLVRIYRHDPLLGINFASALSGTFALTSDEETFRAVPFFFASAPKIAWTLNGSDSGSDPDLTVRTTGASKGTALLGARVANPSALSDAEARLTVQFGQARSTGIFGL